jgi:cellulose biosynthesis protein BcsQ
MAVISVIGPKGGIGKTTLSINAASALTKALGSNSSNNQVCLIDLDLRLPTISSLLDSHPPKTFFDLFETFENKTFQIDTLRNFYQIITWFQAYLNEDISESNESLAKSFSIFKNINTDYFRFTDYEFGDKLYELILNRSKIVLPKNLKSQRKLISGLDARDIRSILKECEDNSRPLAEDYINYIEEYGLSIIGGEVPILGKRQHRKRINEPEFLLLFLNFLQDITGRFENIILDTPAGGVNHLSSVMNSIDEVIFVFDLSNQIAINGSVDALHSFIDYYEDFLDDFIQGRLKGINKAFADKLVAERGEKAVVNSLLKKKFGIVFNRFEKEGEIISCVNQMREYLDILDKLEQYKDRIHIMGMIPYCKIINITNNRGVVFYEKDKDLSGKMDLISQNILSKNKTCPTLSWRNKDILRYLQKNGRSSITGKNNWLSKIITNDTSNGRDKTKKPHLERI